MLFCIFALSFARRCGKMCNLQVVLCCLDKLLFCMFFSWNGLLGYKNDEKMQILQKKSGKCFVVKKKAIPLHSLYNGNSATNDDRLFSSVGQSTWFVISGSLVRIRQEAQTKGKRIRYEVVANAFSEIVTRLGQIPEWPNGADCKSAVFRLRWFESIFAHKYVEKENANRHW